MNVVLLGKRCWYDLCSDACVGAKFVMGKLSRSMGFQYQVVNIDADKELSKMYGQKVPVILVNGEEIGSLKLRESELRENLIRRAHAYENA